MANKERFRMKYDFKMMSEEVADLYIYGSITSDKWSEDDVTAKEFDTALKDIKKQGVKDINVRINSGGGDVFQAVAMRTMLMRCGMNVNISIEGLCASAATLIACMPDSNVTIAEGAMYMIHNPSTLAYGNADDIEKTVDVLRKMETEFVSIYSEYTGMDETQIKEWMDAETWFTAEEAVKYGFCDSCVKAAEPIAANCMDDLKRVYMRVPSFENLVSNDKPTGTAGVSTEINAMEGQGEMEISELTVEMLQNGNRAIYDAIIAMGATAERERISAIDDATPAGYEALASDAKRTGASVNDFAMSVLKAIKAKGQAFINDRAEELKPTAQVKGGAEADNDATVKAQAEDAAAKEMAAYAQGNDSMTMF